MQNRWAVRTLVLCGMLISSVALAQNNNNNNNNTNNNTNGDVISTAGGVYIAPGGVISAQRLDSKALATLRTRAAEAARGAGEKDLALVSLPRLMAEARAAVDAGKPLPEHVRYLGGLTQIRYVLVYPETHDVVLAGTSEPVDASNPLMPVGRVTGRPVVQFDDLLVAWNMVSNRGINNTFGVSIDNAPDSLTKSAEVVRTHARSSPSQMAKAMKEAVGNQVVRIFGMENNTRFALACLAADYRLKRFALGIDAVPVSGVGHSIDNSRSAASRVWFEPAYEPIKTSSDGLAFAIEGKRLMLKAGAVSFDSRGATPRAEEFSRKFSGAMNDLARMVPEIADLQNLSDLALVCALIKNDKLDARAGWNFASSIPAGHRVAVYAVPTQAETLAHVVSGSLAAGGVAMNMQPLVNGDRATDDQIKIAGHNVDWAAATSAVQTVPAK